MPLYEGRVNNCSPTYLEPIQFRASSCFSQTHNTLTSEVSLCCVNLWFCKILLQKYLVIWKSPLSRAENLLWVMRLIWLYEPNRGYLVSDYEYMYVPCWNHIIDVSSKNRYNSTECRKVMNDGNASYNFIFHHNCKTKPLIIILCILI
jgi:hypothetical protein